jgi:hypothetical protein
METKPEISCPTYVLPRASSVTFDPSFTCSTLDEYEYALQIKTLGLLSQVTLNSKINFLPLGQQFPVFHPLHLIQGVPI